MTPAIDWGFVRSVVRMATRHLPAHVDRDDIVQEASIAALRAADRYDPTRGVPFENFLAIRIRGVVRDYIRDHLAPMSRNGHQRLRTVSLNEPRTNSDGDDGTEYVDALSVEDDFDLDLRDGVARELARLDVRTRAFVVEYWMKDRSMRAVGADWDVGEARVSQVLTATRGLLRDDPAWQELAA
jgi:RNA polymerase sigma factor (sigma-70 family)